MLPSVLCLLLIYLIHLVSAGSEHEQKIDQISRIDWAKIEWEKKAPSRQFPISPNNDQSNEQQIASPRRSSAPHRKRSLVRSTAGSKQPLNLQARRHNSAPVLRLQIESPPLVSVTQTYLLSTDISPAHMSSSQELFIASPIDYFDPRFAAVSTPDELKSCGITRESVDDLVKQRSDQQLKQNLQQGLITCSLCMGTFNNVSSLQAHLHEHLD